jgi:hypothetical protein
MRQHGVVLVDVERHQPADSRDVIELVGRAIDVSATATRLRFIEFENFSSVKASRRRRTPESINTSTWPFTFSTPESANTTGALAERVAPRLASSSTATLLTGPNVSARARIRREKLSIAACRYARVPSSKPMTVVSMCQISSGALVRSLTFGFAGWTRSRGRRQPYVWTRRYQVEGDADAVLSRCARTASLPVGT